jgi:excisionase family DNA binding protein
MTGFSEPLWDAKDVAAFLKVSRSWVYLHAEAGTLPSVRIGGLRRFLPEQIRAFTRSDPSGGTPAFP